METIKKNLPTILLSVCATLLLVIVILLANGNRFSFNNNTSKSDTKENTTTTVKKNNENQEINNNQETNTNTNTNTNQPTPTPVQNNVTPTPTPKTETPVKNNGVTPPNEETVVGDENSVISYFENISNMNSNDATLSEKIKSGFVSIVDFIFYDKEIKGHTFKELTGTAKLKIISIALKIDNKIDSYFPGYKERLSEKYRLVKEKLALLYAEYTVKLCDAVGEDACNQFKEDFAKMKESFGITGDYLKDAFGNATDKLREWYEEWRYK